MAKNIYVYAPWCMFNPYQFSSSKQLPINPTHIIALLKKKKFLKFTQNVAKISIQRKLNGQNLSALVVREAE